MKPILLDATILRPADLVPPPSKSDAHRALVLAWALGDDLDRVGGLDGAAPLPRDVRVLRAGLRALGMPSDVPVDVLDAGAPFRMLVALAASQPGVRTTFTGTPRLAERPIEPLLQGLRASVPGARITWNGAWPLVVEGAEPPGTWTVDGSESSQFASGVLLAAAASALARARTEHVRITGRATSAGYLGMTLSWLRAMGVEVASADGASSLRWHRHRVPTPRPSVPGDWSSLGYLLPLAWASGGTVHGLDLSAKHPDAEIVTRLQEAGLSVAIQQGRARVEGHLEAGLSADAHASPDLVPTLVALACVAPARSTFRNVSVLRHKESDRLAFCEELAWAAGATTALVDDTLVVTPGPVPPRFRVHTRDDHRRTMAAVTLAALGRAQVELVGEPGVEKSFPAFMEQVARIGVVQR